MIEVPVPPRGRYDVEFDIEEDNREIIDVNDSDNEYNDVPKSNSYSLF